MKYPSRHELPMSTKDIFLPDSHLDLCLPESYNNHHLCFSARKFGEFLITQTLRDLDSMQERLPKDIHNMGKNTLHTIYEPPDFPTIEAAMNRVMEAYEDKEMLNIYNFDQHRYLQYPITSVHVKQLNIEYEKLR